MKFAIFSECILMSSIGIKAPGFQFLVSKFAFTKWSSCILNIVSAPWLIVSLDEFGFIPTKLMDCLDKFLDLAVFRESNATTATSDCMISLPGYIPYKARSYAEIFFIFAQPDYKDIVNYEITLYMFIFILFFP